MIRQAILEAKPTEDRVSLPSEPRQEGFEATLTQLVQVFKLLSDETRLRILFYLVQHRELHVRALCDMLAQSQPAVSHHLALLRGAELIDSRRDGKHNFYRILPERFQKLLDTMLGQSNGQAGSVRFEECLRNFATAG